MSSRKKFRVWDGETLHEPPHPFILNSQGELFRSVEISPISYEHKPVEGSSDDHTGLDDVNDQPIYEADIVRGGFWRRDQSVYEEAKGYVYWDNEKSRYEVKLANRSVALALSKDVVVIGNLHRHPGILKNHAQIG